MFHILCPRLCPHGFAFLALEGAASQRSEDLFTSVISRSVLNSFALLAIPIPHKRDVYGPELIPHTDYCTMRATVLVATVLPAVPVTVTV